MAIAQSGKRFKSSSPDRLSRLSDELLVKVLSFLSVSQLLVCQRLSHKYQKLARDDQLFKSHYYNRFVRPRASRLPGLKDVGASKDSLHFASKASRWLDEEHLVKSGERTDWYRVYKLRHNWSQGCAAVNEIPVAEEAAIPPVLVQMSDGVVYTVDQTDGLRAWATKEQRQLIAQYDLPRSRYPAPPTAIAVEPVASRRDAARILVGFEDGAYSVFLLDQAKKRLLHQYTHTSSSNGVVSAVAVSWPYIVTMTATQLLSVYRFPETTNPNDIPSPPRLLHSLKSHNVWPPLSISLRATSSTVLISVAYALPTYLSGWTVGIQELHLSPTGSLLESRIASAIDQHYRPLAFTSRPIIQHLTPFSTASSAPPLALELKHIHSKPTSLSYTHPYLLVSHPDNTLTLYLVTSTAESLSISAGSRLWGHTSSVSGASVGNRGKAVSVSRRGDELRVWELEGGFGSTAARKRLASGDLSIQIRPETKAPAVKDPTQAGLDFVHKKRWIGFDDENVVLLKEQSQGRQALVVYDFT
ncbi:uncharacterized protein MYCGRDRAFT_84922 [Zymoseptoria tritici IPO323]|uniref:F-box domain-containing protein n=1 Tax=Zymoseptoria tritici (strain CBS 115943 / IPO323) TaxID=336722 RepID=F9X4Z1_ZYMTI|nr:uncharacterized protein MYCGRDRAFT_84922 [Zymoseptoria tritici IPO323]EGP90211.1 hypothetical protein MYCGRDRAFT_84922 [Zymoseptoria tritici IPO323]